jgi:preprotein translocase subunit SecB
MQPSPLHLNFYFVESLRWKTDAAFEPGDDNAPLQVSDLKANLERDDDEDDVRAAAFRLTLTLEPSAGRFPYTFEIVLIGVFRLDDSVPDERLALVLDANAPALLFGAAREALATSLGRGPFRPLILPTVHFLDMQRAARESAESAPKKRTAKPRATKRKKDAI